METKDKTIMYDSPEAAVYRTDIKGWVSSDGFYCGDGKQGENSARYRGSTHTKCDCGNVIPMRSYSACESCRSKKRNEWYLSLPFKEYDGSPVFDYLGDQYFFTEDDINDYLEEQEWESIDLLFCRPNFFNTIDSDYWVDIMPEDSEGELPEEMQQALNNLNKVITGLPACSYSAGKIRTTYTLSSNETK